MTPRIPPSIKQKEEGHYIILFYKYIALTSKKDILEELFRKPLIELCKKLNLSSGRILIGLSDESEGINGSLSSMNYNEIKAFTLALLGEAYYKEISQIEKNEELKEYLNLESTQDILETYWKEQAYFLNIVAMQMEEKETKIKSIMTSETEFKWSFHETTETQDLFPDLKITIVKELIGTGGVFSSIPISLTSKDYLTPAEFHETLQRTRETNDKETILIDCRNTMEYNIGHFSNAVNPNTKTFSEFPAWVQSNKNLLNHKNVVMYCTGGIRCEKATEYIRQTTNATKVQHLQGGIHKYLEQFDSDSNSLFMGRNFVFDRRTHDTCFTNSPQLIVGECLYCKQQFQEYTVICTVCRTRILVCHDCTKKHSEFHCIDHYYLKDSYFVNLTVFTEKELELQLGILQGFLNEIQVGREFRNKRRTLRRQYDRIISYLQSIQVKQREHEEEEEEKKCVDICRACGKENCRGNCFALLGLGKNVKHI